VYALLTTAAAALLLLGGLALPGRNGPSRESVQVAPTTPSGKAGDGNVQPPRKKERSMRESLRGSLAQNVADAQVVVVGTALDSAPAPAKRPGDLPENLIRFKVKRVLKGKLTDEVITTRTPTAAGEFIGKDWVILLSPDFVAGRHHYASHVNIKLEPTVLASLPQDKK
jgi:hypothetical protein